MDSFKIKRPQRWDQPFGKSMTSDVVDKVLTLPPFDRMDPELFPERLSLREIIANDCRVNNYAKGEIVIREGDYGNSAFLVLCGSVDVCLEQIPEQLLGRANPQKRGWFRTLAKVFSAKLPREFRDSPNFSSDVTESSADSPEAKNWVPIFLQDIPRQLDKCNTARIGQGELFGEVAAISRTPRTATVIANEPAQLLEIRWQGIRELTRFDSVLRRYVDELYRENSLNIHLRETSFLREIPDEAITQVSDSATFETFGDFDWHHHFEKINRKDVGLRIDMEPLIANEGEYINDLILIRNGFARLSRKVGDGHQTLAYLGKGEVFGLREITRAWRTNQNRKFDFSLRAVGHAEIIRIPVEQVESAVLPHLAPAQIEEILDKNWMVQLLDLDHPSATESELETGLIEFLGEYRFINGTQSMLIDLDRCTRCDDCVRACADTHDGNPRFNREGPKFGNQMMASACMHCSDPVCMIGCPTGAIGRDMKSGNILINDQTCIGCSTCANSCPYNNIQMVEISDRQGNPIVDEQTHLPILKATKCDLCTSERGGPACVRACPHDALVRMPMNDAEKLKQWVNR